MIKLVFLENFARFKDLCKSGFNAKKDSNLMPVFSSIRRLSSGVSRMLQCTK